jgi:hypothetical protein
MCAGVEPKRREKRVVPQRPSVSLADSPLVEPASPSASLSWLASGWWNYLAAAVCLGVIGTVGDDHRTLARIAAVVVLVNVIVWLRTA